MELRFSQEVSGRGTVRTVTLFHGDGTAAKDIFFEIADTDLAVPAVLDGFVLGVIFYAMEKGEALHVRGAVSHELLANLREYQEAWTLWRPQRYRRIAITADTVVHLDGVRPRKALAAFSGGVDSIFTMLRHCRQNRALDGQPLDDTLVLVHGFDVPLSAVDGFARLTERLTPLARQLGLDIRVVRTNLRQALPQDWEDSVAAQLACCLHNFSHDHSDALVGSSEPYDALVIPWGSSPITDHLLSGSQMRIIHDGAGYSRTEKVALIARHPTAVTSLKVCWEGPDPGQNCGTCEKCIRTRLNFMALGDATPGCFSTPFDPAAITTMPIRNEVQFLELQSIIAYARRHNVTGDWLRMLEDRVAGYRPPTRWNRATQRSRKLGAALARGDIGLIARAIKSRLQRNGR
ncbi:hypothetical protein DK847_13125 [Aestuariivirga litoralis]|uniref:Uncharacterized protein n=1 Tax=Aestuariivirga litoralis TaxID=2650924 RepID=A0A2W2BJS5_9HYPH|nr:hypothetical protein [Aestuariivirga litoralis]PZF76147.1 hypothetical protein DK847_13125 [Aestuariivirga litoralis]